MDKQIHQVIQKCQSIAAIAGHIDQVILTHFPSLAVHFLSLSIKERSHKPVERRRTLGRENGKICGGLRLTMLDQPGYKGVKRKRQR